MFLIANQKYPLSLDQDFSFIDNKTVLKGYKTRGKCNKDMEKIFLFTILVSGKEISIDESAIRNFQLVLILRKRLIFEILQRKSNNR